MKIATCSCVCVGCRQGTLASLNESRAVEGPGMRSCYGSTQQMANVWVNVQQAGAPLEGYPPACNPCPSCVANNTVHQHPGRLVELSGGTPYRPASLQHDGMGHTRRTTDFMAFGGALPLFPPGTTAARGVATRACAPAASSWTAPCTSCRR